MSTPRRSKRIASIREESSKKAVREKPKKKTAVKEKKALKSVGETKEVLDTKESSAPLPAELNCSVSSSDDSIFESGNLLKNRRNTSTDAFILERPPLVDDCIDIPWPPRNPSEDNNAAQSFTYQALNDEIDVFNEKSNSEFWDSLSKETSLIIEEILPGQIGNLPGLKMVDNETAERQKFQTIRIL